MKANDAADQGSEIKAGFDTGGAMRYSIRQMKNWSILCLRSFYTANLRKRRRRASSGLNIIEKAGTSSI